MVRHEPATQTPAAPQEFAPPEAGLRITVESDNSLLLGLPDEAF